MKYSFEVVFKDSEEEPEFFVVKRKGYYYIISIDFDSHPLISKLSNRCNPSKDFILAMLTRFSNYYEVSENDIKDNEKLFAIVEHKFINDEERALNILLSTDSLDDLRATRQEINERINMLNEGGLTDD